MNEVLIELWEAGIGNIFKSYVALQVHDEYLFCVKDSESKEVHPLIYNIMTKKRKFKTYKGNEVEFSIPIDPEYGINWGTMEGINLLTGETGGESKH